MAKKLESFTELDETIKQTGNDGKLLIVGFFPSSTEAAAFTADTNTFFDEISQNVSASNDAVVFAKIVVQDLSTAATDDEEPSSAVEKAVKSYKLIEWPIFVFMKKGKEIDRSSGTKNREVLEWKIKNRTSAVVQMETVDEIERAYKESEVEKKLLVVNFGNDACQPSREINPFFDEIAHKYRTAAVFVKVDVYNCGKHEEAITKYHIAGTPTFVFVKNGHEKDRLVGDFRPELEQKIQQYSSA